MRVCLNAFSMLTGRLVDASERGEAPGAGLCDRRLPRKFLGMKSRELNGFWQSALYHGE